MIILSSFILHTWICFCVHLTSGDEVMAFKLTILKMRINS